MAIFAGRAISPSACCGSSFPWPTPGREFALSARTGEQPDAETPQVRFSPLPLHGDWLEVLLRVL
jgi:hypothetical protein